MKKLKILSFATLILTMFSCRGLDNATSITNDETNSKVFNSNQNAQSRIVNNQDSISYEINSSIYSITFSANKNVNLINSTLTIKKNSTFLFDTSYDFNISENHWKLKQDVIVVSKANSLKNSNISEQDLKKIMEILNNNSEDFYNRFLETNDSYLVSAINFHKSILNTAISSIEKNTPCNCTVHPAFLLDKTFFNCQEEQYYDIGDLKIALNEYSQNNSLDTGTINLINFLNSTTDTEIRFDDYYNFYVPKENFKYFIGSTISAAGGDCAWWCPLGCGSDWGCCGNYSGCCLFASPECWIHDAMCTKCKPAWFCLPGCKPDKP